MTGKDTSWRQLSDVLGALIVKIEPAPKSTKAGSKQGETAQRR